MDAASSPRDSIISFDGITDGKINCKLESEMVLTISSVSTTEWGYKSRELIDRKNTSLL